MSYRELLTANQQHLLRLLGNRGRTDDELKDLGARYIGRTLAALWRGGFVMKVNHDVATRRSPVWCLTDRGKTASGEIGGPYPP